MIHLVSLFDTHNVDSDKVHETTAAYAAKCGLAYTWRPLTEGSPDEIICSLSGADAAILPPVPLDSATISALPETVRLIIRYGNDNRMIDLTAARERGITVINITEVDAEATAEFAIALMLSVRRKIVRHACQLKDEKWHRHMSNEVNKSTVGIIGFGAVGRTLARFLSGFGCTLLACDPYVSDEAIRAGGALPCPLDELLQRSDIVQLCAACTEETISLISREKLQLLKPTATIINPAQGELIDEDALIQGLKNRSIRSAGLDVFTDEPLDRASALLGIRQATLTPHAAAYTYEALGAFYSRAADIAAGFFHHG